MEARRGGANLHLLAMGQGVGHEVTIRYFVLLNLLNLLQLGVRIQKWIFARSGGSAKLRCQK